MKICVIFQPMPEGIAGATINYPEAPEYFWIFCDSAQSVQKRRKSFGHEMGHICLGHFNHADTIRLRSDSEGTRAYYRGKLIQPDDPDPLNLDVSACEREAEREAWNYYRKYRKAFYEAEANGMSTINIPV